MPYADPVIRKAYVKAYNVRNSEANIARVRQWKKDNPERARQADFRLGLKSNYGITVQDWHALLISQCGECAICGEQMERPYVDHCHSTKRVRNLLCRLCNIGLGSFRDDPELLRKAADYVAAHSGDFL